jgi:hypothetical protein
MSEETNEITVEEANDNIEAANETVENENEDVRLHRLALAQAQIDVIAATVVVDDAKITQTTAAALLGARSTAMSAFEAMTLAEDATDDDVAVHAAKGILLQSEMNAASASANEASAKLTSAEASLAAFESGVVALTAKLASEVGEAAAAAEAAAAYQKVIDDDAAAKAADAAASAAKVANETATAFIAAMNGNGAICECCTNETMSGMIIENAHVISNMVVDRIVDTMMSPTDKLAEVVREASAKFKKMEESSTILRVAVKVVDFFI